MYALETLKGIGRDGLAWYRMERAPHTIMTSVGKVKYWRSRYRTGKGGKSLVPVDRSLSLPDGFMTRPAAALARLNMSRFIARTSRRMGLSILNPDDGDCSLPY